MPTPYEPAGRPDRGPEDARPQLRRPVRGRAVAGVCVGLAEHLGLPVRHVRIGFVVAAFIAGAGLVVYAFLWALTPEGEPTAARGGSHRPGDSGSTGEASRGPGRPGAPERAQRRHDAGGQRPAAQRGDPNQEQSPGRRSQAGKWDTEAGRTLLGGAALVLIGVGVFVQSRGIDLRLGVLVPLLAIGVGAVIAWSRLDDADRDRWASGGRGEREGLTRLVLGIALASVGVVALASQGRGLAGLWDVGLAALAVLGGAILIAAPWAIRLWNRLREEQAERIRETERADIAAHLHDSVLQTLALIQRKSGEPAEVARLARAQERELRGWLYAGPRGSQSTLASAVTEASHEVEDLHGIPIELVVTGDRPLDEPGTALVRALREALLNAVRHGSPPVSGYVEVGTAEVEAFVRDHGPGFDLDTVPEDRLGVRESILGRMTRHGGTARLRRLENGTEVALTLPFAPDRATDGADAAGATGTTDAGGADGDIGESSRDGRANAALRHTDSSATLSNPTRGDLR